MKLYVLIQSCDHNGEGYFQDSIKGIYQDEVRAYQELKDRKLQEEDDSDWHSDVTVRWRVDTHSLIQRPSHQIKARIHK